jgi:ankyrin repeat protein
MDRHGGIPQGEQTKQNSQLFENVQASDQARIHMGNAYTTNVYNPAALFHSVSTTAPDDPVHSEFVNACAEGQRQARLDHLIRRGANIDHRDHMQATPLHHAAFAGHLDIVHYLLDAGADIDAMGDWVGTPLGLAAAQGHTAVVELFLAHRAIPNRCSRYIGTATHMACAAGRLDILLLLFQHGAMLNVRVAGCTRIYQSLTRPCYKRLSDTRAYNLIPNTRLDILFGSPGALAVWIGQIHIVKWLLGQPRGLQLHETSDFTTSTRSDSGALKTQWQRKAVSLPMLAVSRLQIDMLRFLFDRGSDAKSLDSSLRNALFWIGETLVGAIYDSNTSIAHSACLSLLLDKGLRIDARGRHGWTPLIYAASALRFNTARMLLDQGACIDASDKNGRTPLMIAARAEQDEHMRARFVRFLCERGADASIKDASGQTALDCARLVTHCIEVEMVLRPYSIITD